MGLEGAGEGSGSSISWELPSPDQRKAAGRFEPLDLWSSLQVPSLVVRDFGGVGGGIRALGSLNSFGAERIWWLRGREGSGRAELGRGDS